jgi:SecD/SecF fusion protein
VQKIIIKYGSIAILETYKIEEIGNFLMANESLKKNRSKTTEIKPVVKDSLSALLADTKIHCYKKGQNPI